MADRDKDVSHAVWCPLYPVLCHASLSPALNESISSQSKFLEDFY